MGDAEEEEEEEEEDDDDDSVEIGVCSNSSESNSSESLNKSKDSLESASEWSPCLLERSYHSINSMNNSIVAYPFEFLVRSRCIYGKINSLYIGGIGDSDCDSISIGYKFDFLYK